ncbi:MAG: hypothetical protein WCP69_12820 [Bacteroidota bacterium]
MKTNMPIFFKKLVLFLLLLFALDFGIGHLLQFYYYKQKSGVLYRTTYALDSTKAEVLVFGASTANHNYIPKILQDSLKMSCYNVAKDGEPIFYHFALLHSILNRYTPKIVILDVALSQFYLDANNESYDKLSSLYPYVCNHPDLLNIISLKGEFEKYKLLSKIYPYNSLLLTIISGNWDSSLNNKKDFNGYVPLYNHWNQSLLVDSIKESNEVDSLKLYYFENFIKECKNHKVDLYLVLSPVYKNFIYEQKSLTVVKKLSLKYGFKFCNFLNDSIYLQRPDLFSDKTHLNDKGAQFYTKKIASMILNKGNYY